MTVVPFQPSMTRRLLSILALKALILTVIIFYAGIGLGPDEAQYWTWSQALDWGYYSKPPGIAWMIGMGTQLFGPTEWGVRSFSILLAIGQAWAVYRLALEAGLLSRTAFWCALFMAFSPLGIAGSFFAITDVGFLLCWTGACLTVVSALYHNKEPHPLVIACWILAGALFKWPIYLFWIFVLFGRHWYFPNQKMSSLLVGIVLSLAGLLPSLWWNWTHDWATFRHVSATLQGGNSSHAEGNLLEFLGSQALLFSPILFVLLLYALWHWFRKRKQLPSPLFFCGFVALTIIAAMTIASCFQKIQGNWIAFAYPTGCVLLGWDAFQEHVSRAKWAKIGMGLSIAMAAAAFLLPSFYLVPELAPYAPSYRFNPFKHNVGWPVLGQALEKYGYDPVKDFLFSDKYQTTSLLSFYGPQQKRAYFLNLQNLRNNQFSYWPGMAEEQLAKTGYFVWIENGSRLDNRLKPAMDFYQEALSPYFEKVEFAGLAPLVYNGPLIGKAALIFRCEHCRDVPPGKSTLY